jgi:hypothetical protein
MAWDSTEKAGGGQNRFEKGVGGIGSCRLAACLQVGDIATKAFEEEALVRQKGLERFVPIQRFELGPQLRLVLAEIRDGAVDVLRLKALTHGDDEFF